MLFCTKIVFIFVEEILTTNTVLGLTTISKTSNNKFFKDYGNAIKNIF